MFRDVHGIHGHSWMFTDVHSVHGSQAFTGVHGYSWTFTDIHSVHGSSWVFMAVYCSSQAAFTGLTVIHKPLLGASWQCWAAAALSPSTEMRDMGQEPFQGLSQGSTCSSKGSPSTDRRIPPGRDTPEKVTVAQTAVSHWPCCRPSARPPPQVCRAHLWGWSWTPTQKRGGQGVPSWPLISRSQQLEKSRQDFASRLRGIGAKLPAPPSSGGRCRVQPACTPSPARVGEAWVQIKRLSAGPSSKLSVHSR